MGPPIADFHTGLTLATQARFGCGSCTLRWSAAGSITGPDSLLIPEPQEGLMAEEPTVPTPFDAIDLQSLSDEELQRLIQLLMSERERRLGLEPGAEDPE
jgi:hypothetical protein